MHFEQKFFKKLILKMNLSQDNTETTPSDTMKYNNA